MVEGRFPALNDYIRICRANKWGANAAKQSAHKLIGQAVKMQYKRSQPVYRAHITFRFYEPNKRRDPDNISAYGRKVILDGLVEHGVLAGDGWKNIAGLQDDFRVDKDRPRVEIEILEVAT